MRRWFPVEGTSGRYSDTRPLYVFSGTLGCPGTSPTGPSVLLYSTSKRVGLREGRTSSHFPDVTDSPRYEVPFSSTSGRSGRVELTSEVSTHGGLGRRVPDVSLQGSGQESPEW